MTISELAAMVRQDFEQATREDSSLYWRLKDANPEATGADEWTRNMVYEAHDGKLPNDYTYAYIVDALDLLAEYEGTEPEDLVSDMEDDADGYNGALCEWLASHGHRPAYCEEAEAEYGHRPDGLMDTIRQGQMYERRLVFYSVLYALKARLSEAE